MSPLPRTVFGQLALVITLVLLGAVALALMLGQEFATRPAAAQLLHAMDVFASVVERQANQQPHARVVQGLREAGLEVRTSPPMPTARTQLLRVAPFLRELQAQSRGLPGSGREVRVVDEDGRSMLWLKLATTQPLWVSFGFRQDRGIVTRLSVAMLIGCVALVLLATTYFARRLALPLRRLAQAAPALVRGESPPLDALHGPREVEELAQALTCAGDDVRKVAAERSLMLAGISHDLRTPLTRLQYALALLPQVDAELRDGMERDIAEIDAILSQFIAYARDGRDETSEMLDLVVVCRSAGIPSDATWRLALPQFAPMRGKAMALLRAIENLVVNAQRHGAPPFAMTLSRDGEAWRVEVCDQGRGLSVQEAQRVRAPFVHGGERGGSGLGLAIVERVARQHGGELRLSANVPRGLRATLLLRDG